MASFLARALDLPESVVDWFTDDDGDTHEGAINSIADDGVTLGCDAFDHYCPRDNVHRDQMASFLGRGLDLEEIIPPPPTTTTTTTTTMATTSTTSGGGGAVTIIANSSTYNPSTPTVTVGSSVTFDNESGATSHDLIWESGSYTGVTPDSTGWKVTFTADVAGSFDFYCSVHGGPGFGMSGTLTVNP